MGFFDSFSDLLEAALPWSSAEAEAQKEEEEEDVTVCLFYFNLATCWEDLFQTAIESIKSIEGRMDARKDGRGSWPTTFEIAVCSQEPDSAEG